MDYEITAKPDNSKLIRISYSIVDFKISNIKISGDFFIHPEEAIEIIEKSIIGLAIDFVIITTTLDRVLKENNIQMQGISTSTIADLIIQAKVAKDSIAMG